MLLSIIVLIFVAIYYAQYPDNSIPVSALNGNVGVDTESDLSLNANLFIGQDASFNSNIAILGESSFNSRIDVSGDASFNSRVDICGNFYAQYPPNSIPASAIIGGVGGGSNFQIGNDDILFDDGEFALIKDNNDPPPSGLAINGTLTVSGDVSFNNGSVLIPTPSLTDSSNSAVTIGYIQELGLITASGLLRQFVP